MVGADLASRRVIEVGALNRSLAPRCRPVPGSTRPWIGGIRP
jgi:hypothetical protein